MNTPATANDDDLAAAHADLERHLHDRPPAVFDTLQTRFPALWQNTGTALELIYADYAHRRNLGQTPEPELYLRRFPEYAPRLTRLFGLYDLLATAETIPETEVESDLLPRQFASSAPARYEVLRELGRGGSAIVYLARQPALGRDVALKILKTGPWSGVDDDTRILREATTAARLSHPNIVAIHEVGEWEGAPFLAFEWVPGGTLADAIRKSAPFSPKEVAAFGSLLGQAMQYAHEQGVIHRDLKPANILLADGTLRTPKIADFGLSLTAGVSTGAAGLVGTPTYMAPEQATGTAAAITPATDIHALGVILFEMLSGKPPFEGATIDETLECVRTTAPPTLAVAPRDLRAIINRCLNKQPEARFANARDLAEDLDRFTAGRPTVTYPGTVASRAVKWIRRHPAAAALVAACMVVGITLATAASDRHQSQRQAAIRILATQTLQTATDAWAANRIEEARDHLAAVPRDHRGDDWQRLHDQAHAEIKRYSGPEYAGLSFAAAPDGERLAWIAWTAGKTSLELCMLRGDALMRFPVSNNLHRLSFSADSLRLVLQTHTLSRPPLSRPWAIVLVPHLTKANGTLTFFNVATGMADEPQSIPGHLVVAFDRDSYATLDTKALTVRDWSAGTEGPPILDPLNLSLKTAETGRGITYDIRKVNPAEMHSAVDLRGNLVGAVSIVKLHVWQVDPPRLRCAMTIPQCIPLDLWLHPGGEFAIVRSGQSIGSLNTEPVQLTAWHLATGRMLYRTRPETRILAAALNRDGNRLLAAVGSTLELLDARTGEVLAVLRGHTDDVLSVTFSHDGTKAFSSAKDNTLRVWNIAPWKPQ